MATNKPKGGKEMKLALIHFLSNPKIRINFWHLEKGTMQTGQGTIEIQFYEKHTTATK